MQMHVYRLDGGGFMRLHGTLGTLFLCGENPVVFSDAIKLKCKALLKLV